MVALMGNKPSRDDALGTSWRWIRCRGVSVGIIGGWISVETGEMERTKGFEPLTPILARSCSPPELRPH